MYKFNYKSYCDCCFSVGRYPNGNIAVEIWSDTEGPVSRVTINPDIILPDDYLAIKNYSENEGIIEFLSGLGIIAEESVWSIPSGYVIVPVHRLTDEGKEILKISEI